MTHDRATCACPRCLTRTIGFRAGAAFEQVLDDAFDEVADGGGAAESELGALSHAVGVVWRDTPKPLKDYLMLRARQLLHQIGRDPRALLWQVLGLSLHFIHRQGLDKALAVRRAVSTVARASPRTPGAPGRLGGSVQVKAYQRRLRRRTGLDPVRGSGQLRRFEALV